MSFWKRLFSKPVQIIDDFFGELLFMEVKSSPTNSYFEGWCNFKPIGEEIEVGVSGSLQGPTQAQKEFFKQLEGDYDLLIQKIIPFIENKNTFQEWQADFRVTNFSAEFKPVYLFIPDCMQNSVEWEIAFESLPGLVSYNCPYVLAVEMRDYEPQNISVSQ